MSGAMVGAPATVRFSLDDELTVNSIGELTMATSGSHNLRRRSSCNLCARERGSRRDAVS